MPELPEVETICRDLRPRVCGKTIRHVTVTLARLIKEPSASVFARKMSSCRIEEFSRRGKFLIAALRTAAGTRLFLVIHLRMTGQLTVSSAPRACQVSFVLSDGRYLCYNDTRTLGELRLTDDLEAIPLLRRMGPEPLSRAFNKDEFCRMLRPRRGMIKALLMNQGFVAGVGNIYATEALYLAGIRPQRPARQLTRREAGRLFDCLRNVLNRAIENRGTSFRDYRDGSGRTGGHAPSLAIYGRNARPCLRCGRDVERARLSGRVTYFCRRCQR